MAGLPHLGDADQVQVADSDRVRTPHWRFLDLPLAPVNHLPLE